jgi:hypothetical protein
MGNAPLRYARAACPGDHVSLPNQTARSKKKGKTTMTDKRFRQTMIIATLWVVMICVAIVAGAFLNGYWQ